MAKKPLPDAEYLRQCMDYDAQSGRMTWRHRPIEHFGGSDRYWRSWNKRHEGAEALCTTRHDGYRFGVVKYCRIYAHRAAWVLSHGVWPDLIDHINGDPSDNRLCNLRSVQHSENSKNVAKRSDNTSGVVGVYRNCPRYCLPWSAEIYANGRKMKIGNFATIEEAAAARKAAETEYGYSLRHGR
ncbi:HNH endonuclease signature motif containing protein [Paracoccus sp. PAR01]|uniref:HNH endonuclease signature motif containing protein n=1 Tax=Paracoccus sp. PAR01 TaxID=2769282 RepID=UPI001783E617|nr:HNH endonuclease signature motif containing protein [Paracoccus sp. PAR01]MBD9528974.1 HNH endonuclease [Paracoccus sp. PAR01]